MWKRKLEDCPGFNSFGGAEIEENDKGGNTPLQYAANNSNTDVVKHLIEMGTQIEAKNEFDQTPLHFADNVDIARSLVQKGAKIEAKDAAGWTPLHHACNQGRSNVVKYLIEMGVQIEEKGTDLGVTPLHLAKNVEIAKYLIEKGAQIESKDYEGCTPLYNAENADFAKYLVKNGAKIDAKNALEQTPL